MHKYYLIAGLGIILALLPIRTDSEPRYAYEAIPLGIRRYKIDNKIYKFDGLLVRSSGRQYLLCVNGIYQLQGKEMAENITSKVRNLECPAQQKTFRYQVLD